MYIQIIVVFILWSVFRGKYLVHQLKSSFSNMARPALWNTTNEESFHSNVLSENHFKYSTEKSESKDAECSFCKGKLSEDERGGIWIKCFSCSLWAHLTVLQ